MEGHLNPFHLVQSRLQLASHNLKIHVAASHIATESDVWSFLPVSFSRQPSANQPSRDAVLFLLTSSHILQGAIARSNPCTWILNECQWYWLNQHGRWHRFHTFGPNNFLGIHWFSWTLFLLSKKIRLFLKGVIYFHSRFFPWFPWGPF